ncbi:hypothetical protein HOY80DRAFT_1029284 [Tuber brumale]|nr:hypothetical protein HOY80DRAFT_1029284 [Tuber brumale]
MHIWLPLLDAGHEVIEMCIDDRRWWQNTQDEIFHGQKRLHLGCKPLLRCGAIDVPKRWLIKEVIIALYKDYGKKLTDSIPKKPAPQPVLGAPAIVTADMLVEQMLLPLGTPAQWHVNILPALAPTNPPAKFSTEDPDNGGFHTAPTNKRHQVPESASKGVSAAKEDPGDKGLHTTPAN